MLQTALVLVAFVFLFAAYKYGEREGARRGKDHLADEIRDRVRTNVVDPWLESFKRRFFGGGKSYEVGEATLRDCAEVARRLFAVRQLLPKTAIHGDWALNRFATTTQSIFMPGSSIDPHFGAPTGYVDAFLEIMETNDGSIPKCIWLNGETGDVADYFEDDDGPGNEYIRIALT